MFTLCSLTAAAASILVHLLPKTVKTGPKEPRSTVLTEAEEAMIVAFRRHTLLPLDDWLYAVQPSTSRVQM
jgi:hypothetical protein